MNGLHGRGAANKHPLATGPSKEQSAELIHSYLATTFASATIRHQGVCSSELGDGLRLPAYSVDDMLYRAQYGLGAPRATAIWDGCPPKPGAALPQCC